MSIKEKLAALRKAAMEARTGAEIEYGGHTFKVVAPEFGKALSWSEREDKEDKGTPVLEMVRECVVEPESGEKVFAGMTDEDMRSLGSDFVIKVGAKVKRFSEAASGN